MIRSIQAREIYCCRQTSPSGRGLELDRVLETRSLEALFDRQSDQECRGQADGLGDLRGLLRAYAFATFLDVAEAGHGHSDETAEGLEVHLFGHSPGVKQLTDRELTKSLF